MSVAEGDRLNAAVLEGKFLIAVRLVEGGLEMVTEEMGGIANITLEISPESLEAYPDLVAAGLSRFRLTNYSFGRLTSQGRDQILVALAA